MQGALRSLVIFRSTRSAFSGRSSQTLGAEIYDQPPGVPLKRHFPTEKTSSVATPNIKLFPVFALLLVLCPFLGLGLGITMFAIGSSGTDNSGSRLVGAIVLAVLVVVVGGTACAIASFRKKEGHPIAALIGLALSLGPFAALLFGIISKRMQE